MIPLHIAVYYDPESALATSLSQYLFKELMGTPERTGSRIPVSYHASEDGYPLEVSLDGAEHVLSIVLVDGSMAARAGNQHERVDRWAAWLVEQLERSPSASGPHAVLPVALDDHAFALDVENLDETSFLRLDRFEDEHDLEFAERRHELLFASCVAALRLLKGAGAMPGQLKVAPVQVFLSHAKGDLGTGSVNMIRNFLSEGPVDAWYDAKKIAPGARFSDEIIKGIGESSVVVAVVTPSFATRDWCRREVLETKRAGVPLVVVDDVLDEESRSFPYLGNARKIRWSEDRAQHVVVQAIKEALTHQHHLAVNTAQAVEGDYPLGVSPELLTVLHLQDCKSILYPDPPLDREELAELERSLGKDFPMATPLERLCENKISEWVGVSMSSAQDAAKYGGSPEHLSLLAYDLNLLLLRAGCRIGYGGILGAPDITQGTYNFTDILLGLMRGHVSAKSNEALVKNFIGWPVTLIKSDRERAKEYPRGTDFECVPAPVSMEVGPAELDIEEGKFFTARGSAARRFAWARGMTAMRERMNDEMTVRIILGGKMWGYHSRYPGVLEEALLALRAEKPVYLVGAFGGAARVVFDLLRGESREEMTTEWVKGTETVEGTRVPRAAFYDEVLAMHVDNGHEMKSPEVLADELGAIGQKGLAQALNNGLTDQENIELATSGNAIRLVELILTGLGRRSG